MEVLVFNNFSLSALFLAYNYLIISSINLIWASKFVIYNYFIIPSPSLISFANFKHLSFSAWCYLIFFTFDNALFLISNIFS